MRTIIITDIQKHFLLCAIELNEAVLNFGVTDKEFKSAYGYSKNQARMHLKELQEQIRPIK